MELLVVADLAALPERPLLRLLLGVEVLVVLAALPERPLLRLMLGGARAAQRCCCCCRWG